MEINPHGVVAVVQRGDKVEVRYGDGKEPVLLENTTTSAVMRQVEALKREHTDSDEPLAP